MIRSRAHLLLALLLALLLPVAVLAQDGWGFGNAQGGRGGFSPAQGTTTEAEEPALLTPADLDGVVAFWDAGDTTTLIKGGYDLVPADDDYFARTSGALPLVSGGTPQYPISVVCWFKADVTGVGQHLVNFNDGTNTNRLVGYIGTTNVARVASIATTANEAVTTGTITAGRWHCAVFVWAGVDRRAVYLDVDTTGGTNTVSRSPSGLSGIHVGQNVGGTSEWDGVIVYTAVLPVDLSGAGQASVRTAIFSGADPETAAGVTATALWRFDNDDGADSSGNGYDLTASGSPVAQNVLVVMRDKVGTYHQRATTSAPTYDATLFGGRGGILNASGNFLRHDAAVVTDYPFTFYVVASSSSATAQQYALSVVDKDASYGDVAAAVWNGSVANDPLSSIVFVSGAADTVSTTSGYTTNQAHLLGARFVSTTDRRVKIDGGSEGTDTTSRVLANFDRTCLGGISTSPASAGSTFLGSIGTVFVLDTASTDQQADAHAWVESEFGIDLP